MSGYGGGDSWAGYRTGSGYKGDYKGDGGYKGEGGPGGEYGYGKKKRGPRSSKAGGKGYSDLGDHTYGGDYRGGGGSWSEHPAGDKQSDLWGNYQSRSEGRGNGRASDHHGDPADYRNEHRRRPDRDEHRGRGDQDDWRSSATPTEGTVTANERWQPDERQDRGENGAAESGDAGNQRRGDGEGNGWGTEHRLGERRGWSKKGQKAERCTNCGKISTVAGLCTVCRSRGLRDDGEDREVADGAQPAAWESSVEMRPASGSRQRPEGQSHVVEYVAGPVQTAEPFQNVESVNPITGVPLRGGSSMASSTPVASNAIDDSNTISGLMREASQAVGKQCFGSLSKALLKMARLEDNQSVQQHPSWKDVLRKTDEILRSKGMAVLPRDLADFVNALVKLQLGDRKILTTLSSLTVHMDNFTPQDITGVLWSFASLGVRNEALMSVSAAEVVAKIREFDQRQLSKIAWSFAKCGLWNEQLVGAIVDECILKMGDFTAQSISHISWAMAQWGTRREDLMDAIALEAQRKITEFAPAQLGMTAWSFASLQLSATPLMTRISAEAQCKVSQFKTQDLAHLAWAFANLKNQDASLFNIMADEVQRKIHSALAAELTNIAWAYSKNAIVNQPLMAAIAEEAVPQMNTYKPAEVAMITWAFGVAGKAVGAAWIQYKSLMSEAGSHVAASLEAHGEAARAKKTQQMRNVYSAQQLSHIAWAFGALSLGHADFCNSLSKYIRENMNSFKAGSLANIAWSFAMVGFCDHALLELIAPDIARDVSDLQALSLSRCAWAYRMLSVQVPSLMATLAAEAARKVKDFPSKGLTKLVDATYLVPEAGSAAAIQEELVRRIGELADFFLDFFKNLGEEGKRPDRQEYSRMILQFGMPDAGLVATPVLLSRLGIGMPSFDFIDTCKQQHMLECAEGTPPSEFAAAEVALTWMCMSSEEDELPDVRWKWEDFLMRYTGGGGFIKHGKALKQIEDGHGAVMEESYVQMNSKSDTNSLLAVDLRSGEPGRAEPAFAVLDFIHANLQALDANGVNGCSKAVIGSVQVFCGQVPSVSEIGCLHQFHVLYPSVVLGFVEQSGYSAPVPKTERQGLAR